MIIFVVGIENSGVKIAGSLNAVLIGREALVLVRGRGEDRAIRFDFHGADASVVGHAKMRLLPAAERTDRHRNKCEMEANTNHGCQEEIKITFYATVVGRARVDRGAPAPARRPKKKSF